MLINWTAFSQSIKADKKIDSFYCFGPTKARELAKMQVANDVKDSINAKRQDELDLCEYVVKEFQTSYKECTEAVNISSSQLQHKDVQIEAKESEKKGLKKELKNAKTKGWVSGIITTVSIGGNIILGIKLASK